MILSPALMVRIGGGGVIRGAGQVEQPQPLRHDVAQQRVDAGVPHRDEGPGGFRWQRRVRAEKFPKNGLKIFLRLWGVFWRFSAARFIQCYIL